jgi:hypothetical protein
MGRINGVVDVIGLSDITPHPPASRETPERKTPDMSMVLGHLSQRVRSSDAGLLRSPE